MLILTRKIGESVFFELEGERKVALTILNYRHAGNGKVVLKVGIDAAPDVAVLRDDAVKKKS